jgi:hypothetical protein
VDVRLSGVVIGHIRRHPSPELYWYFRRAGSGLAPIREELDLERLKGRIRHLETL